MQVWWSTAAAMLVACAPQPDAPSVDVDDTDPAPIDKPVVEPPLTEERWVVSAPVACADPGARTTAPFVRLTGGDWDDQAFDPTSDSVFVGGGLTVADLDGDDRLDLLVTSLTQDVSLWLQVDGPGGIRFAAAHDRLPPLPERSAGATAVDVDADGDLDVFVAVFKSPDVLLRNDGGTLVDATDGTGLAGGATRRSMASSWADVDGDGDLDAFVAGYGRLGGADGLPDGDPSSLYLQQDDGTFVDVVPSLTTADPRVTGHTFMGAFVDADADGWLDLYLVNDFGWVWPSLLMSNQGGTFAWDAPTGAELYRENMGLGIGDLNGDEVPDFFVTAWDAYGLFLSRAGTWYAASDARGLTADPDRGQHVAWGNQLADLDNDGDLDAVVAFGMIPVTSPHPNPESQPDAVYLQGADGLFVDVAPAWGLDQDGRGRAVMAVDLDRNGFLDLVRTDLRGPTRIDLARCDDSAWLELDVRQGGPNRFGIGTHVRVVDGDMVWTRDIRAGGTGYGSGEPPEIHVGLGQRDTVQRVEVTWPDGSVSVRTDVPTRTRLRVERP